jgi:hypothetical protein
MKKTTFLLLILLTGLQSFSQTPQAINYQAVARNAQGLIIPTQNITIRFSVLDGSVTGTVVYQETQSATTNNYGLFTLAIGKGTPVTGTFAGINWASGTDKFLKVEIASSTAGSYDLQGTTQLLSVPYALYSEKTRLVSGNAINITNGNTISGAYTGGPGINIVGPVISGAYTGGTGISVSGSTISHNLQAGTGINITGPTISGAYTAGTGINITGATISGAYQAGNAISITGNTIAANYTAGTGINITGNVISAPASVNYWQPHANGIYYNAGKVGIGTTPDPIVPLSVFMPNTGAGNSVAVFNSSDTWHTGLMLRNTNLPAAQYAIVMGAPSNVEVRSSNFGILNQASPTGRWAFVIEGATNNIGIGHSNYTSLPAKSKLHVFNGDVNIDQIGSGIIMKSPNGQCWRITIDNTGTLLRTAITCP